MAKAPSEFRILRAGSNPGQQLNAQGELVDVDVLFDSTAAKDVIRMWKRIELDSLPIDVDHGMLNPKASIEKSRAHAWFVPQVRGNELWATNIKWDDPMAKVMQARGYRFMSPVILGKKIKGSKQQRAYKLINVSLTNTPALRAVTPLVASSMYQAFSALAANEEEKSYMNMEAMKSALESLAALLASEDVSVEDKLAAAQEAAASMLESMADEDKPVDEEAMAADESKEDEEEDVIEAAASESDEEDEEKLDALSLVKQDDPNASQLIAFIATAQANATKLSALQAQLADKEAVIKASTVDALLKEGRLAPALKQWALSLSDSQLADYAKTAPVLVSPAEKEAARTTQSQELSDEDAAVLSLIGLDPKKYGAKDKKPTHSRLDVSEL